MQLLKIYFFFCFYFFLSLNYMVQGTSQNSPLYKKPEFKSSTIYQFERPDETKKKLYTKSAETNVYQEQQSKKNSLHKQSSDQKLKSLMKNTHGVNRKLLNKLGLTKVRAPNSHNRKRLAVESRMHASPDDSHMFIIKLPPNLYYYSGPKVVSHDGIPSSKILLENKSNGKKVSFPFNSNGKPGHVYHWNLPAIKKILDDNIKFSNMATAAKDQLTDIKNIPTWTRPWENETIEKSFSKSGMMDLKKSLKRKSPSYYAPTHAVNKNSFNKYFPGNGKPKGIYVIKENQKKRLYFKNIVE